MVFYWLRQRLRVRTDDGHQRGMQLQSHGAFIPASCLHARWCGELCTIYLAHVLTCHLAAPQYMAGGDLRSALVRDITANGAGPNRCLGWYARGRRILVGVARGLVFMPSQGVRISASPDIAGRSREAVAWGACWSAAHLNS